MKAEEFGSRHLTNVGSRIVAYGIVLFAAITMFIAFDIVGDYRSAPERAHGLFQGMVIAFALAGLVIMWLQLRAVHQRADQLSVDLEASGREAQCFREEDHDALRGLGEAIDHSSRVGSFHQPIAR